MARIRHSLLIPCAALVLSAAAAPAVSGQVADVLVLPDGALFVALDETPSSITVSAAPGRLSLALAGWTADGRTLIPHGDAGFSRLEITGDGFVLVGDFAEAHAELRTGGVLIRLGGVAENGFQDAPRQGSESDASASAQASSGDAAARAGAASPEDRDASVQAAARADAEVSARTGSTTDAATPASAEPGIPGDAASAPAAIPAAVPDRAPEPSAEAGACDAQAAALADAPWDLDRIVDQADCLVEAGEQRNAAGLYERVLAFQPEHFRAALGLARLRQQAGRYDDAARLFETAAGSALTDGEALSAGAAARRAREQGAR